MNTIKSLIERIEEYRTTNKNPCKSYASEAAAEKAGNEMATKAMGYYGTTKPIRYVVFFNQHWGKWVVAFDLTELCSRNVGGYLGYIPSKGFYTY